MRLFCFVVAAILAAGCASPAEPHTNNLGLAYGRWSAFHPASYSFDLSIAASTPPSGPTHITVANGQMSSARNRTGESIQFSAITIDTLWARILSARQNGTLNSAEFTMSGVPTDVDMGDWALDGGIHYAIRNFAAVH